MSSRQQLQPSALDSAACYSQQSAESSSGIGSSVSDSSLSHAAFSSLSASPADSCSSRYCCEEDAEWCGEKSTSSRRPNKKRRGDRKKASKLTANQEIKCAEIKKANKNAKEQERVAKVRKLYDLLEERLGDRVERSSAHFSKNDTLKAAIKRLKELIREYNSDESPMLLSLEEEEKVISEEVIVEPSPPPPGSAHCITSSNDNIVSLNCEERLPVELDAYTIYGTPSYGGSASSNNSFEALFQEDIPHVLSTAPYFSYSSSPNDYNTPVLGGNCMFPVGNSNIPPSASMLCSPDLNIPNTTSQMLSLPPVHPSSTPYPPPPCGDTPSGSNITLPHSTLEMSPPLQPSSSYHCGSDMWLAIGCN